MTISESAIKMQNKTTTISIVCPCFNEQDMVGLFMQKITAVLIETNKPFEIIFVNDGSTDNTLDELLQAKQNHPQIRIINLSRNFGKEAALTAGFELKTLDSL